MRLVSRTLVFATVLSLLGLLAARAEPAQPFRLEARVPASTLAFASVEDLDGWQKRMETTAFGQMALDPEMQAFVAPINDAMAQMLEGGMLEIPPVMMDVLTQLQGLRGQLGVALVGVDMEQEWFQAVLSLDFGDSVEDFVTFLTRMKSELDPSGEQVLTMPVDGRTWWKVPVEGHAIFATTVGTAFVVCTDEALLKQVLAGAATGSLHQDADFQSVKQRAGGDDVGIFAYANVDAALAMFGEMIPPQERQIADALGLDTIHSLGYGMAFAGDGFKDTLIVNAPAADHGILSLIQMPPLTRPRLLDLAPAGSFYWEEGNLPLDSMMAKVRSMVGSIDPDATQQMDEALGQMTQMLGVDIEKEMLGGLDGWYGLFAALSPNGGLFPEVGIALGVKDALAYEGVFDRLTQGIAGLLNEEGDVLASTRSMDYHGVTMHLFEMQAARGDDPVPFTPTWAILDSRLVITLVPHTMKELVLRSKGEVAFESLKDKEDFAALWALRPETAGAMGYLDLKRGMALLYDTGVPLLQTLVKPNVMEDVPFPLDWSLLPPASRMLRYFRSFGSYVTWNENGIEMSMHAPFPMFALAVGVGVAAGMWSFGRMSSMPSSSIPAVPWEDEMGGDLESEMDMELAKIQAEMLLEAVEFYRQEKDALPANLKALVDEGLVGSVPQDPWGGAYRLMPVGGGSVAIESAGADKAFGTSDDVRATK